MTRILPDLLLCHQHDATAADTPIADIGAFEHREQEGVFEGGGFIKAVCIASLRWNQLHDLGAVVLDTGAPNIVIFRPQQSPLAVKARHIRDDMPIKEAECI